MDAFEDIVIPIFKKLKLNFGASKISITDTTTDTTTNTKMNKDVIEKLTAVVRKLELNANNPESVCTAKDLGSELSQLAQNSLKAFAEPIAASLKKFININEDYFSELSKNGHTCTEWKVPCPVWLDRQSEEKLISYVLDMFKSSEDDSEPRYRNIMLLASGTTIELDWDYDVVCTAGPVDHVDNDTHTDIIASV